MLARKVGKSTIFFGGTAHEVSSQKDQATYFVRRFVLCCPIG
jgi:hypothetical protein